MDAPEEAHGDRNHRLGKPQKLDATSGLDGYHSLSTGFGSNWSPPWQEKRLYESCVLYVQQNVPNRIYGNKNKGKAKSIWHLPTMAFGE